MGRKLNKMEGVTFTKEKGAGEKNKTTIGEQREQFPQMSEAFEWSLKSQGFLFQQQQQQEQSGPETNRSGHTSASAWIKPVSPALDFNVSLTAQLICCHRPLLSGDHWHSR